MRYPGFVCTLMWAAAIALLPAVTSTTASADHRLGFHWGRKANPFTIVVAKSVRPVWNCYIDVAVEEWSRSDRLDIRLRQGSFNPLACNPSAGRIRICSAKYGDNGWLGLTQLWISDGHTIQATSKLNDTYFVRERFNTKRWRQLSVCHEIGHTFGLAHQDENTRNRNIDSCLDLTNKPRTNQLPNLHDFDVLSAIYRHTDDKTTVKEVEGKETPEATSDWGKAIHLDEQGKGRIFVRTLGQDKELVTIVTWTGE